MISKVVGFSVEFCDVDRGPNLTETEARILGAFPWLRTSVLREPGRRVVVWGHGEFARFVHEAPDGALWILSNANAAPTWSSIVDSYATDPSSTSRAARLQGIFVLVRMDRDAVQLWTDWTGASKVFTWALSHTYGAVTLEPLAVAAAGAGESDIASASLFALMRYGSYLGTSTLYRSIRVVAPDSHCRIARGQATKTEHIQSIRPSDSRWTAGWDDVVEEWKALLQQTFADALRPLTQSTLMLSGGIDSRLIAAIGAGSRHTFHAVSYGNELWQDGVFAKKVAAALDLPFSRYEIGADYLSRYTRDWCDWFGTSMCVHGMYQMPALIGLRADGRTDPITTGFTGDPLEGQQIAGLMSDDPSKHETLLAKLSRKFVLCSEESIGRLLPDLDLGRARSELEADVQAQHDALEGAEFQKRWLLFQWNRVFQFSSYQPMMYEYHFGVVTPFVDSRLANFTLSLPRYALEGRRTILEMIRKHFPAIAKIPGTYDHPAPVFDFIPARYGIPLLLTKAYLAKAALGYAVPKSIRRGPLREFGPAENTFAKDAIRAHGVNALYPLDKLESVGAWRFDPRELRSQIEAVLSDEDLYASAKLWSIQALLHRFATPARVPS